MVFKKEEVITLKDANGNDINVDDTVVYTTNSTCNSIIAKYKGIEDGLMKFVGYGVKIEYRVKPSNIKEIWKVQEVKF